MGSIYQSTVLSFLFVCSYFVIVRTSHLVELTLGFTELPLNTSNFKHHKPYDLPVSSRYSFHDGVHKFWAYSNDKPLSKNSPTRPRSEIKIEGLRDELFLLRNQKRVCDFFQRPNKGYDYSSGVWQFEGHGYVPSGTSGFCIMQVFGYPPGGSTLVVRTYNDSLTYYRGPVLVPRIWDKWFQLNVIHDVEASIVRVYIDRVLVYEAPGHGGHSYYFKFGVYTQNDPTFCMESRWKGIRVFHKIHYP